MGAGSHQAERIRQAATPTAKAIALVAVAISCLVDAILALRETIVALLIVVAWRSHARTPGRRRGPVGPGNMAGGRQDPADWN